MSVTVSAQRYTDIPVNNRVIFNKGEYIIYAEVDQVRSSGDVGDDVFYYWYSANDVKRTQGGYEGKLLHGKYTEFYSNKDLKVQGKFSHGVKSGRWKMWHANGQLSEIQLWTSNGRRTRFESFDENGHLIRTGTYRYEKLHGTVREIGTEKTVKRKYRNGIEVIKIKKVKSDSTSIKKGEKKKKFRLLKIRLHKKDTLNNNIKRNEVQSKNKKKDKGVNKPDDMSKRDIKNNDAAKQEAKKKDSKKPKRRKKDKATPTNLGK